MVGADGAATLGNATGTRTVIQPVNKPSYSTGQDNNGCLRPVGLGQLYCARVESLWKDKKLGISLTLPEVQKELCEAIQKDAMPALATAQASIPSWDSLALFH